MLPELGQVVTEGSEHHVVYGLWRHGCHAAVVVSGPADLVLKNWKGYARKPGRTMQKYDETLLNELTQTLLYEGYSLYPQALNNKKTAPLGVVFPRSYSARRA